MSTVDQREFRHALGAFATGVTIVTTRDAEGRDVGMTANSFNSVSLDPPMVLWSLARTARSLQAYIEARYFAVHILASDQQTLSNRFAQSGADKFSGLELGRGLGGIPLLKDCAARFDCETAFLYEGGDHEIIVGKVLDFESFDREPLAFLKGNYAIASQAPQLHAEVEADTEDTSFSRNSLSYLVGNIHYLLDLSAREMMKELKLSRSEIYMIWLLGNHDCLTLRNIQEFLEFTGLEVSAEKMDKLENRGLVTRRASEYQLSAGGRDVMIRTMAMIKATEDEALEVLDYSEIQLIYGALKQILGHLHSGGKSG